MKNYYIVENRINDYLCVNVKCGYETQWARNLQDIFTKDFYRITKNPGWRYHMPPAYKVIAEFDELPSSYEEFVQLYPEFCI